ncbi:MAG TPA: glycosyltransferase family 4 protein [Polyangiaceae bacterium]|nr:glycosyltransferase family 4 protein [Polyangiaceae bacterium]
MQRVLFVSKPIAAPFHDGTKCLVRDVARELRAVAPVVLTTKEGLGQLPPGVSGRAVYGASGTFAPALLDNARAAFSLLSAREDLWHFVFAPNPRTGQVARGLRALRRVPIVQTVASPPRHFSGLSKLIFGDELVVQSRATEQSLREAARREGFALPPITVIPPPVPASLLVPDDAAVAAARRELDLRPGNRVLLYPGDLEVSSGAEVTRALVKPLLERVPNAIVVFAYRNKTSQAAGRAAALRQALVGEARVRITDSVSSMHALLRAVDIVIFPVDDLWGKVDQPIVLLEALALGTPCVVLDQGPLKDVVGARKVATIDVGAWLEVISAVLSDSALQGELVAQGHAAAREVYASGVVARAYEAIYLRVLARSAR